MDRLIDKLIVLTGCAVALAVGGPTSFAVVGVLCALVASGAFELLRAPWRTVPMDALLVASMLWSPLLPCVPLMAYDAARGRGDAEYATETKGEVPSLPALATWALTLFALVAATLRLPPLEATLIWLLAGLALSLSLRTSRNLARDLGRRKIEDELRGRGIALEARNRDLRERRDYETDLATMAERARIARDIHDSVGHLLTRASLQVEALRVVHEMDGDPALDASLEAVRATVDEALSAVRQSVRELHEGTLDLADRLRQTVGEFEEQSGVIVELACDFDEVTPPVALAFLACVREALSNATRHGHARTARVRVMEYPALWQLTVTDDGGATSDARTVATSSASPTTDGAAPLVGTSRRSVPPCAGLGLSSMEERVIALGGHFLAGPVPDGCGWRVFCSVPKETEGRP